MSLFSHDIDEIKKAILYFDSLSPQQKALVVADLGQVDRDKKLLEKLQPLLGAIQTDISKYDETTISQKLFELGMEDTYAKLLVSTMIKQAPTLEYEINILSKMVDDEFLTLTPSLMKDLWAEQMSRDEMVEKYKISPYLVEAFADLTRTFMNGLARRTYTEKRITSLCKDNGLSDKKIDSLLNTLKINSKFWSDMLIFTNTQDVAMEMQELRQQNNEILTTMKDILKILKEYNKQSGETRHFQ